GTPAQASIVGGGCQARSQGRGAEECREPRATAGSRVAKDGGARGTLRFCARGQGRGAEECREPRATVGARAAKDGDARGTLADAENDRAARKRAEAGSPRP